MERETGLEPATFGLGSHCSTTELLPLTSLIIELQSPPGKLAGFVLCVDYITVGGFFLAPNLVFFSRCSISSPGSMRTEAPSLNPGRLPVLTLR